VYFLARKSHLAATVFFLQTPKKKTAVSARSQNEVQKFTPTKISGGFRISGRYFPGYMSGRNTADPIVSKPCYSLLVTSFQRL